VRGPRCRRARRAAVVLLLALGLARCAPTPRPVPPAAVTIAAGQAAELARQWAAEWEAFTGMRAAIDLTVKNQRRSDRTGAVLLVAPTAIRVEVATPFGFPALVATVGPDDVTIFRVLERRAHVGRPSPGAVERWLGIPLPPVTLIRLLIGNVPPPRDPGAIVVETTPSSHLAWTEDGVRHRVWVAASGRPARLVLDAGGGDHITAEFEWSVGGPLAGLRLEAPERAAELLVRYLSAEYVPSPPEVFRLTLPADVPVEPLD
jgi:hypothetical protein